MLKKLVSSDLDFVNLIATVLICRRSQRMARTTIQYNEQPDSQEEMGKQGSKPPLSRLGYTVQFIRIVQDLAASADSYFILRLVIYILRSLLFVRQ